MQINQSEISYKYMRNIVFITILLVAIFLWSVRSILPAFALSFILAYLCAPLTDKLQPFIGRPAAAAITTLLILLTLITIVCTLSPLLYGEFAFLAKEALRVASDKQYLKQIKDIPYIMELADNAQQLVTTTSGKLWEISGMVFKKVWSSGYVIVQLLSLIILTPIVTFFMLKDYNAIINSLNKLIPAKHQSGCAFFAREVNSILARYIRGQSQVCLGMGIYYAVSLSTIGLKSAITIGALSGIVAFVPYVGFSIGLTMSALSVLHYGDPSWMYLAIVYIVGYFFENYLLAPKLLSKYIKLSPALILFTVMAGGSLAGFLGVLVAIPVAAVLRTITKLCLEKYFSSSFYQSKEELKDNKSRTRGSISYP